MEESTSFGYWVRRRRKALDLTQAELGRRAGASAAMIRKIEADERRPSRELAELLAQHLAVSATERQVFLQAARNVSAVEALVLPYEPIRVAGALLPPPSNLPAPMTSLVNRVSDLANVTSLLQKNEVRLLTLLGPPGIGKTRLSIQAGQQMLTHFADGVWFVDLSTTSDSSQALSAMVLTLDLPAAPNLPPVQQLQAALRDRRLLLILDNIEHIVHGTAPDVAKLLRACSSLKVLATSRVRLDIYGEHEYPLPPMSIPPVADRHEPEKLLEYEAVQLFVARARQHRPDFEVTVESALPIAQICRQMDGLPLALELAAAKTRRMSVSELAAALGVASGINWHAVLGSAAQDLPPRQRTLFNAIAWSYSLLDPRQQAMLNQLGIFVGPFDMAAIGAVVSAAGLDDKYSLRDSLDRLVDHNLVSQVSRKPERWRLLEMVREFALGQLSEVDRRATSNRHAHYYSRILTDLLQRLSGKDYQVEVEAIVDNCRAALQWALDAGEASLAYTLSAAFEWYWEQRGLLSEGRRFLELTLTLPGEVDDDLRFEVLHGAANHAWMQRDFTEAHKHTESALALASARNDSAMRAGFLNLQARIYLEEGQYQLADQALVEGLDTQQLPLRRFSPHFMVIQRGEAALGMGQLEQAEFFLLAGLDGITDDDVISFCVGWTNLAEVALARADASAAVDALRQVVRLASLHERRLRIFLVAVAGCALMEPAPTAAAAAAALLGHVSEAGKRLALSLSPMTQRLLTSRRTQACNRLSPEAWKAACDRGRELTAEDALQLATVVLSGGI